ncbi:rCG40580 [Rattus norvegicus]|uniref:RCG40580 n=1 Tax=Rattus norvegicus TaxID=10116 RepID=A6I8W8_RAT|nr:rCG40580 [Rattus norvegicus]
MFYEARQQRAQWAAQLFKWLPLPINFRCEPSYGVICLGLSPHPPF